MGSSCVHMGKFETHNKFRDLCFVHHLVHLYTQTHYAVPSNQTTQTCVGFVFQKYKGKLFNEKKISTTYPPKTLRLLRGDVAVAAGAPS